MAAHHVKDPAIQGPGHLYLRRTCYEGAIISYARCFRPSQGAPVVRACDLTPT
jgi:hypothetical protein